MLTLLVRTSYRPQAFSRLLQSVNGEANILVSYDNDEALSYIPSSIDIIKVNKQAEAFSYNRYVNDLKQHVTGWMLVADDDDTIIPGALRKLKPILSAANPGAVLVQFMRGTFLKPHPAIFSERRIKMGHIGFPSLILHSDYKDVAQVGSGEYADYYYIRDVAERAPVKWVSNLPVVSSPARGMGVMEK